MSVPGLTVGRIARVGFAVLDAVALGAAFDARTGSAGNFFSFFTILSNVLGIVVLLVGGLRAPTGPRWAALRGAATLYLVITGIVYAVLLSNQDVGLTEPWINSVLHRVTPVVVLVDWLLLPPWPRASWRLALGWLGFPLAYFAYSLLRGPVVDWYPYPFLDPRETGGYGRVATYAVALAALMMLLSLAVAWLGQWRATARQPSRDPGGDVTTPPAG
ncbi:Pr6Pr family membrane protein [Angustibacter luteus]|uniref:Pr6Pr family membrane protein n=1 Tax=Angustibacter luteus TaxID=658456 RepID=A0ABW1JD33_9ACTN